MLRIGTSGYSYKEWLGSFYPPKLAASKMLGFYAQHFSTVEINNTFYRMPKAAMLATWTQQVPAGFVFVIKAPQKITHRQRLVDCSDSLKYFYEVRATLGQQAGPTLFQLPPFLKVDVPRLADFLAILPAGERATLEFRHESWHSDAVYEVLHKHNAALCVADADEGLCTPQVATANWGYARLRRQKYPAKTLKSWAQWLTGNGWLDSFVFFKHEDEGQGPAMAQALAKTVAKVQSV